MDLKSKVGTPVVIAWLFLWLQTQLKRQVIRKKGKMDTGSLMDAIRTPMGAVLMLVITLIFATLTVASAISGELTAAAIGAAGLLVIVVILGMINMIGK